MMKKMGFVIIIILILLGVTGCGSNYDFESLEERVAALEKANARLASQIAGDTKETSGITTQENTSNPTLPHSGNNEKQTTEVSEDTYKEFTFSKYQGQENRYVYSTVHLGCLYITIPDQWGWTVIEASDKLVLELKNAWIDVILQYDVDRSILDAPGCEKKIRSITSEFLTPEATGNNRVSIRDYLALYYSYDKRNIDDMWWIEILDNNGACYYHEQSTHTIGDNDLKYSLLQYEAYYRTDVGALHATLKVISFDFMSYFNSLETTIEKSQASDEFERLRSSAFTWNYDLGDQSGKHEYWISLYGFLPEQAVFK
ncbi:MAG: hypothetical protein J5496_04730 [Lachnospiraceae bacterium]|nr:hypothetical protein [Lachnospiraceae bacterium]